MKVKTYIAKIESSWGDAFNSLDKQVNESSLRAKIISIEDKLFRQKDIYRACDPTGKCVYEDIITRVVMYD